MTALGSSDRRRALALLAGALIAAHVLPSQAQEPKSSFELKLWKDENSKVAAEELRPNSERKYQLYARNPGKNNQDLVVKVFDGPDSLVPLATIPLGNVPAGERVAVTLPKLGLPAAPAPDLKADPKAPPAPPAAKALPLPKGSLTFRLAEKNNQVEFGKENAGKLVTTTSFLTAAPATYLRPNGVLTVTTLKVNLADVPGGAVLDGKTTVDLVIPPQDSVRPPLPPGVYRRELAEGTTATLQASGIRLNVPKGGGPQSFRYYLNVDGVPRAFSYVARPTGGTAPVDVTESPEPAIRLLPLSGRRDGNTIYALPADKFRVRVEADSAPSEARLEMQINRLGTGDAFDPIALTSTDIRESRYSLLPTEDGSLMVSNVTGDREIDVDVRGLRGTIIIRANMLGAKAVPGDLTVVLDDTKPEVIPDPNAPASKKEPPLVRALARRLVKGKTLAVEAFAQDAESGVASAFFFTGEAPADGVFPPDFKKVAAKLEPAGVGVYKATAQLPIPTDSTGVQVIGVAFVNQVGLVGSEVQQIELIDPKDAAKEAADANPALATGTLKGEIMIGEVPQPELPFVVTDAEGKQKFYKTDVNGRFKIEKVLVGSYKLSAGKPDASFGTKGEAAATVEKDKVATVAMKLTRTGK